MIPIIIVGNSEIQLTDCISCTVTQELSQSYELTINYPIFGENGNNIKVGNFIKTKPNIYDEIQIFKIYRISKQLDGTMLIYAEHISYILNGYIGKANSDYKEIGGNVQTAMTYLAAQGTQFSFIAESSPEFGENAINWSIDNPEDIRSIMANIAKWWGGEWKYNNYNCTLVKQIGEDRNTIIQYAENLIDFSSNIDNSSIITHIVPYWKGQVPDSDIPPQEGEEIPTHEEIVYSDDYYVKVFNIETDEIKAKVLDCSSDFSEKPLSIQLETQAVLYASSELYADIFLNTSYTIDFIQRGKTLEYADQKDLDYVELGDEITIKVPQYNITTKQRCLAYEYDVILEKYNSITIGKLESNIGNTISQLSKNENTVKKETSGSSSGEDDEKPDSVTKNSDNKVTVEYPNYTVVYEADGTGNERHNFRVTKTEKEVTPTE